MKTKILVSLFFLSFRLFAGNDTHGGDSLVGEFRLLGKEIVAFLMTEPTEINPLEFQKALDTANIASTEENLFLNEVRKEALSYPSLKKIVFNRMDWKTSGVVGRWILVVHEVLNLMGKDDSTNQISILLAFKAQETRKLAATPIRIYPRCFAYVKDEPSSISWELGIKPEPVGDAPLKFSAFSRFTDGKSSYELILAEHLECQHAPYTALTCKNSLGEEFSLSDLRNYKAPNKATLIKLQVEVSTNTLKKQLEEKGYLLVSGPTTQGKFLSPNGYDGLIKGKIPLFLSSITGDTLLSLQEQGAKSLQGKVQYTFDKCAITFIRD